MRTIFLAIFFALCYVPLGLSAEPIGIKVFPEHIDLTNAQSSQRLTVQYELGDGTIGAAVNSELEFQWSNPAIVKLERNNSPSSATLFASQSGETKLTVQCVLPNGKSASATALITCNHVDKPLDIEFNNHETTVREDNSQLDMDILILPCPKISRTECCF